MRFGNNKKEILKDQVEIDLSIDTENLNKEIMDQPLLFKKYSDLDAETQRAVRTAELQVARVKAEAHLKYSQKGLKVKDVESMVDIDPVVVEVSNKLLELYETADKIRGIVKALYQRHESLKDLAANRRKELAD
jgi:hypothetical protein